MSDIDAYDGKFPYPVPRDCQVEAIDFALSEFQKGKKIVIVEAGTGVGKSAVGVTVARLLQKQLPDSDQFGLCGWYPMKKSTTKKQPVNSLKTKVLKRTVQGLPGLPFRNHSAVQ